MKCILLLIIIGLFSSSLFPGTTAKITANTGHWLTIGIGTRDGVKIDMKGKVQQIIIDNGVQIPFNLGIFVVKKVTEDSAELYIEKVGTNAQLEKAEQVEFYDTLKKKSLPAEQLFEMKNKWEAYLREKQFKEAGEVLNQALKLKPGDKDIDALLVGIDLINAPGITVDNYIEYKEMSPSSPILNDVKERLYQMNANLPPEKYLADIRTITKNSRGYYEVKFKNSHIMVYIPGLNLFVDKYELSNLQYLRFAGQAGIQPDKITFSTPELVNYPGGCDAYPAIVSYDQAENYCRKNSMRLPTEAEWETIAGNVNGFMYSWGNEDVAGGNVYRANYESIDDGYVELAPTVSFEEYASPYGVVNMVGNVREWVKGQYSKGGGFLSEREELKITAKSEVTDYVGFRCVLEAGK